MLLKRVMLCYPYPYYLVCKVEVRNESGREFHNLAAKYENYRLQDVSCYFPIREIIMH